MTQLGEEGLFKIEELEAEVDAGYVNRARHPTYPLSIYSYSRACQYEGRWNDVTTVCRGLILDDTTNEVVARPLKKFHNVSQHGTCDYAPPLPNESFEIYEKLDGSLSVIFYYDGQWIAASKGSFISDQANWANAHIKKWWGTLGVLKPHLTYCAEIIYPENRIVVSYGTRRELVFLAAFHPDGTEAPFHEEAEFWPLGSVASIHKAPTIDDLIARTQESTNGAEAEGFVIRFRSGLRVKAKYVDYVRLHKLMTGITERDIWRAMAFDALQGTDANLVSVLKCSPDDIAELAAAPNGVMASLVDNVPDDYDSWVKAVCQRIEGAMTERRYQAKRLFQTVSGAVGTENRGEFARTLQGLTTDRTLAGYCFAMLDGKPTDPLLWRSVYPAAAVPFAEDDEG